MTIPAEYTLTEAHMKIAELERRLMTETWSCPHGTEYSGSADFISGARNAHDEFYGLGICRECHGTKRIKVIGFTDGLPRGTACCPTCARAALAAPTNPRPSSSVDRAVDF